MASELTIDANKARLMGAALCALVRKTRQDELDSAAHYQHRRDDFDRIPFIDVYTKSDGFPGAYPEQSLKQWRVERVIVTKEPHPSTSTVQARQETIEGWVLLRYPGRPRETLHRVQVTLRDHYAQNGNLYRTDVIVSYGKAIYLDETEELKKP